MLIWLLIIESKRLVKVTIVSHKHVYQTHPVNSSFCLFATHKKHIYGLSRPNMDFSDTIWTFQTQYGLFRHNMDFSVRHTSLQGQYVTFWAISRFFITHTHHTHSLTVLRPLSPHTAEHHTPHKREGRTLSLSLTLSHSHSLLSSKWEKRDTGVEHVAMASSAHQPPSAQCDNSTLAGCHHKSIDEYNGI